MYKNLIIETTNLDTATQGLVKTNENLTTSGTQTTNNLKLGMQSYLETIKDVNKQIQDATVNAFKGMEDALVNFVMTGKMNFADFTRSILADITRIIIRQSIITPLLGVFGITTSAKGNVFDKGLKEYAKGGIVTQPTLFKYGSGGTGNFGLMGEAGAEAILPLKRGRSGNLGVEASGGATNIVVNVDASGSSVEGDEADGKALGMALSAAIESELIKQKRPGGLLA
jgi:lambda family phage tail tape measure protein